MNPRTMAQEWAEYRSKVVPMNAHQTQVIETRRAFYSGAFALLVQFIQMSADDISDDDGAEQIERWRRELDGVLRAMTRAGQ